MQMPKAPSDQSAAPSGLPADHKLVIMGSEGADLGGATVVIKKNCETYVSKDKLSIIVKVPPGLPDMVEITLTTPNGVTNTGSYRQEDDEVLIPGTLFITATAMITIPPVTDPEYGKTIKDDKEISIITVTMPPKLPAGPVQIAVTTKSGDCDTNEYDYSPKNAKASTK
jgi:hypothetical protein